MTSEQARELARQTLSPERFHHTECVAKAARALAKRYGADEERCALAAFLHDILKERDKADLLKMIEDSAIIDDKLVRDCPGIYHAFAGGVYVRETLGLDEEIGNAVMYHTTGRAGMSKLEKIVMLADYMSEDRDFRGVDEVRVIAERSLDEACFMSIRNLLVHVIKNMHTVNVKSIESYNWLKKELKEQGVELHAQK
ncbi:MAG: bis(5'-nucleosyl)-tetraphosphatase (symmetrical) YqeK [Oscillospiraceae bacterium]|nr:bis(5'-nucleosyl)-tetraphosphatase (symmetrical) YqeK [Oscillospiraceae bacterium]